MNIIEFLTSQYQSYETHLIILEIISVLFGLLSVFFSIKKNIWVYPTGIINTMIATYIMLVFGLLGDMLINVYYTIMSIYGWVLWSRNSEDHIHIESKNASVSEWKSASVLFLLSAFFFGSIYYYKPLLDGLLNETANTAVGWAHLDWANYVDILTSSLFLVGMYFMAKRNVENWIFWIIGDFLCIPLTFYKGLGFISFQYLIFTIMAIIGYIRWRKSVKV